jgi:hypothetical protein
MTADSLLLLARVVVVATFTSSALAKARDLDGFHGTLLAFRVASDRRARRLAPLVLAAEVLAVLLAAVPATAYAGLALATGLLVAYTALLVAARSRGATAGCHCFGRRPQPLSWWDVGRNAVLLAAVAAGLASGGAGLPPEPVPVVAAGLALVLLAVHLGPVADALRAPLLVEETP